MSHEDGRATFQQNQTTLATRWVGIGRRDDETVGEDRRQQYLRRMHEFVESTGFYVGS